MPGTNQAGSRTYIRYRTVTSRCRPGRRSHSWNRFLATTSRLALPVRRAGCHRCLPSPYRFRRLPGMDRLNRPPAPRSRAADLPARSRGARHRAELTTPRCLPGPPAGGTASSRRGDDDQFRPDALRGERLTVMNAPVRGQAPPRLRPSRTLSGRVGRTCRFRAAAGPVSAGLRSPPWRKKRPFPGPAGRGTLGCRRHSGRTRCQPASRRDPLGSLGRSAAWSRPDRDQDRPWLAAGRHQAVLFRGALVHRRAGNRGGAGREPAVRGQHP